MSDAELRELVAQLAVSRAGVDRAIEKMAARVDAMAAKVDATGEMIGFVSGRIGVIIELVVTPGICGEINKYNHEFTYVAPNMEIRRKGKDKRQAQVDVMLYNTTEAMAVEIKTRLKIDDVRWHIEKRLTTIREMETEFNIKDKVLYGAVAGISIDEEARKFAVENGLYVIEIKENENTPLDIDPPVGGPGKW